jgi:tagatose-1,6-bisphosphate aldolase
MILSALKSKKGSFNIIELDYAPVLASKLGLDLNFPDNIEILNQVLSKITKVVGEKASAVVLDPVYSLFLLEKLGDLGLVLRLEQESEATDPLIVSKLIPNWGVENIKNNYGVVKLELFYHPSEENALQKKQLVAEIHDYCFQEKTKFLIKLNIYTPANEKPDAIKFQEAQLQAINELGSSCDCLALQYPQDPLNCATITSELDVPWILFANDMEYEQYKEFLRTSLENGAQGFMISDILWQGMTLENIDSFVKTTLRDRLIEITRIADGL